MFIWISSACIVWAVHTSSLNVYTAISMPSTKVVTLAVYSYLFSTLFGGQFLDPTKKFSGSNPALFQPIT